MTNISWNPEYYLKQGYSPEESRALASEAGKKMLEKRNASGKKVLNWKHSEYWIQKGFGEEESKAIINFDLKRYQKDECIRIFGEERGLIVFETRTENLARVPRLSPFSQAFWLKKGLSLEEAQWKANSLRPIRKEYWMSKGLPEHAAILKAQETKDANNKKGAKGSASREQSKVRDNNHRCIEYYLSRGYSESEAKLRLSQEQTTFSLEICIKKYGPILGYERWLKRQKDWQSTLTSKCPEEINHINSQKNCIRIDLYKSVADAIERLSKTRNMRLVKTFEEFDKVMQEKTQKGFFHLDVRAYYEYIVPNIQKEILGLTLETFVARYSHLFHVIPQDLLAKSGWVAKRKPVDGGYLRSSYEIYFHDIWMKNHLSQSYDLQIGKSYPQSNLKFDFSVTHKSSINTIYIEICPLMLLPGNEGYVQKMQQKQKVFGCELLATKKHIDAFISRLKNAS